MRICIIYLEDVMDRRPVEYNSEEGKGLYNDFMTDQKKIDAFS
jgi:hypothetical protein